MSKPAKRRLRLSATGLRLTVMMVLSTLALGALLYSVYGQRPQQGLQVGDPSPQLYRSPIDIEVIDQLATERERQAARDQIPIIYTSNPQIKRLVVNAIATAGLPAAAQKVVVEAYEQPKGVSEEELPGLIDRAVALADLFRQHEVRLVLEDRLVASSQANTRLTEAARDAAASKVEPVWTTLEAGQVIVREGDTLTEENLRALEAVGLYNPRTQALARQTWIIATCLLLAVLLSLPALYAYQKLAAQLTAEQTIYLVGLTVLALIAQRLILLADASFLFVALVPLLVAVLVSELAAINWALWLSVVVALLVPDNALPTLLTVLIGSVTASLLAMLYRTRSSLLLAGTLSGVAGAFTYAVYHLLLGAFGTQPTLIPLLWILLGGVLAGIVALALLPLSESSFGFLTEFRLLELSSPSSPLLQKLLLEAPGTYQHSLIISNLVEQAVTNIGGNALIARVGALYHDVGKLKRPQFFVENQFSGNNPHDQLSPHLSYLIITSHVRDGVDLLRNFKLPKVLEAFVSQHHGTTVLTYFYKRALEDNAKLDELNFRYAGPKPQSKETAVLMLADSIESASRTLVDPGQSSIRAMIDRLIEQRLQDGQLAESPLNFHDLDIIANTFERMLTAILHRRIRYPSTEEIQGLKHHGGDSRRNVSLPAS